MDLDLETLVFRFESLDFGCWILDPEFLDSSLGNLAPEFLSFVMASGGWQIAGAWLQLWHLVMDFGILDLRS